MEKKTILIPLNQGFAVRYLLQTDIFPVLQRSGHRLVVVTPNPDDRFFRDLGRHENVIVAPYDMEKCRAYQESSRLGAILKQAALFIQNGRYDIRTVEDLYQAWQKDLRARSYPLRLRLAHHAIRLLVGAGRKSRWVRRMMLWVQQAWFSPDLHRETFRRYEPDLLVVTSLGTFDYDQFFMREARKRGVKVTAIVLSWDNTTTRGMPAALPDHVVAWTDIMRDELIGLNDIPEKKISVGGVAHFDHYYREETFLPPKEFYPKTGLDPGKKTLFFVTKSPNGYAWNSDIAKCILKGIRSGRFREPVQLMVRLHPIYYRRVNGVNVFQSFLDEFRQLQKDYPELVLNEPVMTSEQVNYLMPEGEIRLLASILKKSDVVINIFSTLNLEACIFDKPIVNICFEGTSYQGPMKARYNIRLDEDQTHNQRVVKSGGIRMAYDAAGMIDYINEALENPSAGREGRARVRESECGPHPGRAGRQIADHILRCLAG